MSDASIGIFDSGFSDLTVGTDALVLGCARHTQPTGVLSYVMGDDVTLVSSAQETANDFCVSWATERGVVTTGRVGAA